MIARFFAWIVSVGMQMLATLFQGIFMAPKTAMMPYTVRRAEVDELIAVRHAVLRKGRPVETAHFDGDKEPGSRHWVCERDGTVVGVVTVLERTPPEGTPEPPHEPKLQLRGMAVLPDLQGKGVGGALLGLVHAEVDAPMWCNARESAVPFYVKHGWTGVGESWVIDPIGPHLRMYWVP